ncbi:MAG: hypothetical protein KAI43_01795 [Candidatus Aureabacteria bacterium]|nr:hypothetical protein [Candidatus Auribacterota bacterium]
MLNKKKWLFVLILTFCSFLMSAQDCLSCLNIGWSIKDGSYPIPADGRTYDFTIKAYAWDMFKDEPVKHTFNFGIQNPTNNIITVSPSSLTFTGKGSAYIRIVTKKGSAGKFVLSEGEGGQVLFTVFKGEIVKEEPKHAALDDKGRLAHDFKIEYKIIPDDYIAETVEVEILKNEAVISTLKGSSKSSDGEAVLTKGTALSPGKYQARLVLNKGNDKIKYVSEVYDFYVFQVKLKKVKSRKSFLDRDKRTKSDFVVQYQILPEEYVAKTIEVDIIENNNNIIYTLKGSNLSKKGKAILPKRNFIENDNSKEYSFCVVLNRKSKEEFITEKNKFDVIGPWFIEDMSFGNAADGSNSKGLLMIDANAVHESSYNLSLDRMQLLAYAFGADLGHIPFGGSCWAEAMLGGSYEQNYNVKKVKVWIDAIITGEVSSSAAIVKFNISSSLNNSGYKTIYSTEKAVFLGSNYTINTIYNNVSAGKNTIRIKSFGKATANGDGNTAITEFNDKYSLGNTINITRIVIEAEE